MVFDQRSSSNLEESSSDKKETINDILKKRHEKCNLYTRDYEISIKTMWQGFLENEKADWIPLLYRDYVSEFDETKMRQAIISLSPKPIDSSELTIDFKTLYNEFTGRKWIYVRFDIKQ